MEKKQFLLSQSWGQVGMKHFQRDHHLGHEEIWSLLCDVSQWLHTDHQVSRTDVRRAMVLNQLVKNLKIIVHSDEKWIWLAVASQKSICLCNVQPDHYHYYGKMWECAVNKVKYKKNLWTVQHFDKIKNTN